MFYEVRVFDSSGKIQKVVSQEELSREFWKHFFADEGEKKFASASERMIPRKLKNRLRNAFPELYDMA